MIYFVLEMNASYICAKVMMILSFQNAAYKCNEKTKVTGLFAKMHIGLLEKLMLSEHQRLRHRDD